MNIYGLTDKGMIREANEDCIGISCLINGITIAVVCDGMGGAAGGQIASAIAEKTFMDSLVSVAEELEKSKFDSKKIKWQLQLPFKRLTLQSLPRQIKTQLCAEWDAPLMQ